MNASAEWFRCLMLQKSDAGHVLEVVELSEDQLPLGDVTIDVQWSSLNYKDALAASGHPGVVKRLPHIPGIDAAGVVRWSASPDYPSGQAVLVTGYDLGQGHWGGWSERIRVPADWVVPLPAGLSPRTAMIYGTAGFTAAQCVMALQLHGVTGESGPVVVTGASGGVGSLALRLLAMLGYRVVAVSGKQHRYEQLIAWGAQQVIGREDFVDDSPRPMLHARWAGGVDTVGGPMLSRMLKELRYGGCVAACGLVGGADLNLTLYPFLLRGCALCGIASADCPRPRRLEIWKRLATHWKLANLEQAVKEIGLEELAGMSQQMLRGEVAGRILVRPSGGAS